jgi:CTP synthase (UTP-ammonia lyase)
MHLGVYPCKLKEGTKVHETYSEALLYERYGLAKSLIIITETN